MLLVYILHVYKLENQRGQEVKKEVKIEELKELDTIVNDTLKAITKKELLLLMKLEETKDIINSNPDKIVEN